MRHPILIVVLAVAVPAQGYLRVRDDLIVRRPTSSIGGAGMPLAGVSLCATQGLAWHSQAVTGGGTLSPLSFANPATIGRDGLVAFYAGVSGVARNQGIFVADAQGLRPIAIGCGQGGGSGNHGTCGDPAPGGGTFAGFFGGTPFVPAQNARGDLLFVADLAGGPSPRGLFLYRADTATFAKVAAVGDPAPNCGYCVAIGPGSLNASREVV